MAMSMNSICCSSYLHPKSDSIASSLSCPNKVSVGLRLQSLDSFGIANPDLSLQFHRKVHKSIEFPLASKPKRGRVVMMPIGTPRVLYRSPENRSKQFVDLWNALYRERIIFLGEEIDEQYSNMLLATMLYLDTIDSSRRMYLYIKSYGGDLTPTMSIYDTMQSLKSPVATHCLGYAFNLAAFLLAAGEKGRRSSTPSAYISLEAPAGAAHGQADDVQNEAKELIRVRDYLFKELSKQTGQPLEKIHEDIGRKKHFSADEALEYGLIDRIVRPKKLSEDTVSKGL